MGSTLLFKRSLDNDEFRPACTPSLAGTEITSLRNDVKDDIKRELTTVIDSVDGLKNQVQSFLKQFNNCLCIIEDKIRNCEARQMTSTNTLLLYDIRITKLSDKISNIQTSNDNDSILHEVEDRLARRNNALFLGIEEQSEASTMERKSMDLTRVQNICDSLNVSYEVSSPKALLTTRGLIILGLLKAKRAIKPLMSVQNISIVHDRTKLQRNEQKKIRQLLHDRTAAGEQNLRIVTRNGRMMIVKERQNILASTPKDITP
ncbi:uncharacterized protein LOC141527605 [Cotesia typhae]|uniref:uncharacterized protein LOC141527605 n=1 Tax=Cotesia typhae TaxID=2053667 RepID=UPI003D68B719